MMYNNSLCVVCCILGVVGFALAVYSVVRIKKCCKGEGFKGLRDMGPTAGGDRVQLSPDNPFVSQCNAIFEGGGCSGDNNFNVCGDDTGATCQDNNDMSDMGCYGSKYTAYSASDCSNPLRTLNGYLCRGNNRMSCPSGGRVVGDAPQNPWGCTSICQ